ncbi:DUF123 domain-containing protein [Methanonatronarchaeum sp. AMET-Sl]|uniref:GIY-YIG nuclease family protein n=1 Tax=Methanonatronarchaeum sp. AMET-Sl TaxID=3037654 RepID=UPI00244DA103|nr:DUF123 domain-containing protein [Methanonatronarchaeum sp. AMET-Sl]WGI17055.1 DUF123 domain-containing protein [Methanonatronarchaeum sp. AMET-Sl]
MRVEDKEIKVGALGEKKFNGIYIYVGSALGPGGLKRIKRHIEVGLGKRDVERWHIDYLLKEAELIGYVYSHTNREVECDIARELNQNDKTIDFGCSDCKCESHLFRIKKLHNGLNKIKKAYINNSLQPKIKLLDDEI